MSGGARLVGLVIAAAMFVFSVWMFTRTGDWVAAVFAIGSMAYGLFFMDARRRGGDR